jgi:glutamate synthase domain-containing protein 3
VFGQSGRTPITIAVIGLARAARGFVANTPRGRDVVDDWNDWQHCESGEEALARTQPSQHGNDVVNTDRMNTRQIADRPISIFGPDLSENIVIFACGSVGQAGDRALDCSFVYYSREGV